MSDDEYKIEAKSDTTSDVGTFESVTTTDFWISTKRASVVKMFKSVDAVVINDEEAKLLTKEDRKSTRLNSSHT